MDKTTIGIGIIILQAVLLAIQYISGEGLICIPVLLLMIFNNVVQRGKNE